MRSPGRLLIWAVIGLASCTGSKSDPMPVGHIVPLNGPDQFGGEQARQAVRLAVEDLNKPEKRGNLRPVLVQHADGRNGPATATRLVKIDHVLALLDSTDPGKLPGIAAVVGTTETPLVTAGPWTPTPPNEFVVSLVASPAYQGTVLARLGREELKLETVVVWADGRNLAWSATAEAFSKEWVKLGGKTGPGPTTFDPEADPRERAEQIKSAPPSAVLFVGPAARLVKIRAALQQALPQVPLLFAGDEAALLALSSAPSPAGKVYLATAFASEGLTEAGKEIAKTYQEHWGQELDAPAALAYDGIRLLTGSLRKASSSGVAIRKDLLAVENFDGLTGPLSFTKDGCARRPVFVVAVEGGRAQVVKSFDAEPK